MIDASTMHGEGILMLSLAHESLIGSRWPWLRLCVLVGLILASVPGCGRRSIGSLSSSQHWQATRVSDPGRGESPDVYWELQFVDSQRGWVPMSTGDSFESHLLRTSDGGRTWADQGVCSGSPVFVNERVRWTTDTTIEATPRAKVGRTIDGGASWEWSEPTRFADIRVSPISASEAWAIGKQNAGPDELLHTVDGGKSWRATQHPLSGEPNLRIRGLGFPDRNHKSRSLVALAELWKKTPGICTLFALVTHDAGNTFQEYDASAPRVTTHVRFPARLVFPTLREGWIAYGSSALLHTTDGGKTWETVTPLGESDCVSLDDCSFPDRLTGWAVGAEREKPYHRRAVAVVTRDGGEHWSRVTTGAEGIFDGHLTRVVFVDKDHGWATGEGGIQPSDFPRESNT